MKKHKIFTLLTLFTFALATSAFAQSQKFGTLDLSRTFDEYIKTKEFDAVLSEKTEEFKKESVAVAATGDERHKLRRSKTTMVSQGSESLLVEIRGLVFARGSRVIFDGVDIDIPRGKVTAIMGPSGTGKTTLLKLIGGQLRPQPSY